jgi:uncharacterized membrane protein
VHFAVVILPIASLSVIVAIYFPKYANKFAFASLLFVIIGTASAFVANQSGKALAEKIGLPQNHANYGDLLLNIAIAFTLLSLAWYLIRIGKIRQKVKFLDHLTASFGLGVIGLTVITGHTGAQAVWEDKIKLIESVDTSNTQTAMPSGKNLDNGSAQDQNLIYLTQAEV